MPDVHLFVNEVSAPSQGTTVGTIHDMSTLPGWNGSSALLDGGCWVTANAIDPDVMHITDEKSPNAQSWDLPCGHALAIGGLASQEASKHISTASDATLLRVSLLNPWGSSVTNQQDVQDIPYAVLQGVANYTASLPMPSTSTPTGG